jgi:hypothetical protein
MVSGFDWQWPDPDAWDPDNPLALLQKAATADEGERAQRAIWAVRSMIAAAADAGVMIEAREFVRKSKVLRLNDLDRLEREARGSGDRGDDRGPSVATQLVEIAQELYTFGVSDLGEAFAIPNKGPKVVAMLRGSKTSLRALLARECFSRTGRAATQQALADALLVVEGMAQEADESQLYLRAAQHGRELWLDLGDHSGRAVKVTGDGWSIEDQPPVLFKRTSLTSPLPEPRHGGSIEDLWSWLNVSKDDRPLIAAALVHALFSDQPHVILAIFGEHGTAKTTALKILVLLLDPSPVLARKPPRDSESWITAASGSWVVGLDNMSEIPDWLSDSLCRASTGDGDVRRKLYTDGDFSVFSFRRVIIFDGIDVGALQPDLADRTVPITLELIADQDRKDEQTFWGGWAQAHPQLLGAVLDLAASVLARLPSQVMERKPRMADFAKVLAAVDAELGTTALARYATQAQNLAAESLSDDALAGRMTKVISESFTGTSAELLKLVTPVNDDWKAPKDWPAKPRTVTSRLRRLAPAFRKIGWLVEDLGSDNHDKLIRWSITPPARSEKGREQPRQSPQDPPGAGEAGDAGIGGPEIPPPTSVQRQRVACPRHADTGFGPHPHCPDCQNGETPE